jgi:hydrogenase-4 membrane subunit HyfE
MIMKKKVNKSSIFAWSISSLLMLSCIFISDDYTYMYLGLAFSFSGNIVLAIPAIRKRALIAILIFITGFSLFVTQVVTDYQAERKRRDREVKRG